VDPERVWRVALLAALLGRGPGARRRTRASVRLLVQSSPLAVSGITPPRKYGIDCGWATPSSCVASRTILMIRRLSIAWRGRKLGYVPRRENAALAWGLDRGEPLRARISRLAPHPNPARRVEFEVYFE